jgi:hypothetical protein
MVDLSHSSTFTGAISGASGNNGLLTLSSAATGLLPLWEGEVIGCNPSSASCPITPGTQIISLASGLWGANGSTYNVTAPNAMANVSATPMQNQAYFQGGGAAYYVGPTNDLIMQTVSPVGGLHPTFGGPFGGNRTSRRMGVLSWSHLTGNPTQAEHPTLSRTSFTGCDAAAVTAGTSPCFDIGSTFQASASGAISGSTVTFSSGLAANARPFVPGMALSCAGCNSGLFILSVSAPPTQSTVSGAGQVGQSFTITANGNFGVSTLHEWRLHGARAGLQSLCDYRSVRPDCDSDRRRQCAGGRISRKQRLWGPSSMHVLAWDVHVHDFGDDGVRHH